MSCKDITTSSGIYQIRNIVNGKVYVGSAVNIVRRWAKHRNELNLGIHKTSRLQRSWKKHGADKFVFEVLELVCEKASLISVEQKYFNEIRPFDTSIGYNT